MHTRLTNAISAGAGPTAPTADAFTAVRPLPLAAVALDPRGHLGAWQQRNAFATLPHCVDNLESSGALGNLRRAAGRSAEPFIGMWFADSDVYKTLEAAAWQLAAGSADDALTEFVASTARLVAAAQEEDGYLDTWFQVVHPQDRWADLKWGHELYCAGHLIQAGVAAMRAGTSTELAEAARRAADLLVSRFGENGTAGICGHPEIETALAELFRATGDRKYLELALRMIELRGQGLLDATSRPTGLGDERFGAAYFQDHEPVRAAATATGHAVRQLYLEAGVVDVATELRDTGLLEASERRWDDLFNRKTYLTGAHGSRHRDEAIGDAYELPPDRAYAETCAAIASFNWNWRLLLATGHHRYADEMERVLYNAIAVSTSLDGKHFFYSNPLQLRTGHDGVDEDAPSQRLPWYACACCPPNLARLIACLHNHVATIDDSGVQLHLLTSSSVCAAVPGGQATLRVGGQYPWNGRVTVQVDSCDSVEEWTLALRVPGWCQSTRVWIDGEEVPTGAADGYLRVRRRWMVGTSIAVELDMPPRFVVAHEHVDAVRGCVALARGPLVYCFEQADLPDTLRLEDVQLDVSATPEVVARDDLLDLAVTLVAQGVRTEPPEPAPLYRDFLGADIDPREKVALTAIPYYRWGNRNPGAMRVWIPTAPTL